MSQKSFGKLLSLSLGITPLRLWAKKIFSFFHQFFENIRGVYIVILLGLFFYCQFIREGEGGGRVVRFLF